MSLNDRAVCFSLLCAALFASSVNAQWGWGGNNGNGDWNGCPPWRSSDECDNDGDGDGSGRADPNQYGLTQSQLSTSNRVLIIHAVLASLVWVVFVPLGGILLRLGIRSPWILRLHAIFQVLSYLVYIVAVGLGIWLINQFAYGRFSMWSDPHPQLGIAILTIALSQPILGFVHHRLFKRRVADTQAGRPGKKPGRTAAGYLHLWIGRVLIVLGMVNGGLGLRLAGRSPFTSNHSTKVIAYSVTSAVMFLIYVVVVVSFERRKAKQDRQLAQEESSRGHRMDAVPPQYYHPPSYDESQESLRKQPNSITRYQ